MTTRCSSVNLPSRGGVPVHQRTDARDLRASVLAATAARLKSASAAAANIIGLPEACCRGGTRRTHGEGACKVPLKNLPSKFPSVRLHDRPKSAEGSLPSAVPAATFSTATACGQEHPAICCVLLISIRSGSAPIPFLPQVLSICKGRWRVLPSIMNGAACVWLLTCGC